MLLLFLLFYLYFLFASWYSFLFLIWNWLYYLFWSSTWSATSNIWQLLLTNRYWDCFYRATMWIQSYDLTFPTMKLCNVFFCSQYIITFYWFFRLLLFLALWVLEYLVFLLFIFTCWSLPPNISFILHYTNILCT